MEAVGGLGFELEGGCREVLQRQARKACQGNAGGAQSGRKDPVGSPARHRRHGRRVGHVACDSLQYGTALQQAMQAPRKNGCAELFADNATIVREIIGSAGKAGKDTACSGPGAGAVWANPLHRFSPVPPLPLQAKLQQSDS